MNPTSTAVLWVSSFLLLCLLQPTKAILPTGAIDLIIPNPQSPNGYTFTTLLASQGNFAPMPPMSQSSTTVNKNDIVDTDGNTVSKMTPIVPPENDPLLCGNVSPTTITFNRHLQMNQDGGGGSSSTSAVGPYVMIVPRGTCSFQHKALVAQKIYGASGVIIYGTLASRYDYNETNHQIIYPSEYYDYDCSIKKGGGKVNIPKSKLIGFDESSSSSSAATPYDIQNDYLLSGSKESGNLCALYSENDAFENSCPSKRCLLTGNETSSASSDGGAMMEACCAWDTHVFLYKDDSMSDPQTGKMIEPITIPTFYITMEEANELLRNLNGSQIVMYSRWYPKYNISAVLIWALGVFVAAIASYLSASEIRHARKSMEQRMNNQGNDSSSNNGSNNATISMRGYEPVSNERGEYRQAVPPQETLELTPIHAVFFIIFSSAGLLTLFFFKIYNVVKIFYAFGCSGAIMQIIVMPLYLSIAKRSSCRDRVVINTQVADIGSITMIDLLSIVTSYGLGAIWIYLAFTVRHPETIPFFWIMQNIMGACMCILFLQTMQLNSIKVASILLIAAFFYDIFFVFVTPLLTKGGKSIMVDVATSGGPPQVNMNIRDPFKGSVNYYFFLINHYLLHQLGGPIMVRKIP